MIIDSPIRDAYFRQGADKEFSLLSKKEAETVSSTDSEAEPAAARFEDLPHLHELGRAARSLRKIVASTKSCEQR